MTRFHHGHSMLVGALLAVAFLHGHILWALTAVFVFGVAVGRGWGFLAQAVRRLQREALPLLWKAAARPPRPW